MIVYRCPRADLGCDNDFASSAELDDHLRWGHGYRRSSRYAAAFRPAQWPVGGKAAVTALADTRAAQRDRHAIAPGGFGPGAAAGAVRVRRQTRERSGAARAQRVTGGGLLRRLSRRG